jgi:hypothetical protein
MNDIIAKLPFVFVIGKILKFLFQVPVSDSGKNGKGIGIIFKINIIIVVAVDKRCV